MSKAEQTKAFIIEKTAPIFNSKGFWGTSLSDLTEATGLTKGSIYGNFENKEDVAIAAFEYNVNKLSKNMDVAIHNAQSAIDKMQAFTDFYRSIWKGVSTSGGCPILNTAVEADDNLPFLKKRVQNSIKGIATRLIRILDAGKANGEFRNEIDSSTYAYTFIAMVEGGIMLSKITGQQVHLFTVLDKIMSIVQEELKVKTP
ncbi:TetR/AcrR family transcriptional regulator [Xanthocytophaga flava]|uniref:TetR/AcrR family transcriptional regulator n=1 Tax=Xanthocytophaga flava TaxID=3048013 RepID=UPI0028D17C0D|nr:TetR/AcrR family transcriptional regulator [Xanthocytophaga flavus]MDJ1471709.1 TetR/AcrR family transcriptional regulator [Xanthocytophaga flavus]